MNLGKYVLSFAIVLFLALLSCTDEFTICTQNRIVDAKAQFYTQQAGAVQLWPAPQLNARNINANQAIATNSANASGVFFKLYPTQTQIRIELQLAPNTPKDTLTITYSNQLVNLGVDCGEIHTHVITNVSTTTNYLDSVLISNANVTNSLGIENLRVFY